MMFAHQMYRARLRSFFTEFFCEAHFRPDVQPIECVIDHAVTMEVEPASIRCRDEAVSSSAEIFETRPCASTSWSLTLPLARCARASIWRLAAANASLIAISTCTWLRSPEGWWLTTMFPWGGIVTQMLMR